MRVKSAIKIMFSKEIRNNGGCYFRLIRKVIFAEVIT